MIVAQDQSAISDYTFTQNCEWLDGSLGSAVFDTRKEYRFLLTRDFNEPSNRRSVTFIMLNPSTADAATNDPTITRCCNYAKSWGYGRLEVVNLYALRATDPRELRKRFDPTGGVANETFILESCKRSGMVICAWGALGKLKEQAGHIRWLLRTYGVALHALAFTKDREPRHPLYLRGDLTPTAYEVHQ